MPAIALLVKESLSWLINVVTTPRNIELVLKCVAGHCSSPTLQGGGGGDKFKCTTPNPENLPNYYFFLCNLIVA